MSSVPLLKAGSLGGLKTRKAGDDNSKPSIIIYGGSGVGKTTLAASASEVPDMNPIVHLNIENGTQSIANIYPDIDVVDIRTFVQLQDAYNELHKGRNAQDATCLGYRTVIIDNLTEGQKQGMEHVYKAENAGSGLSFSEFTAANWADGSWNKNSEQMRRLIRAFRDLPVYVIFVAWEKDLSKNDSKLVEMAPAFSKSFATEAPGMVNDVYYYHFDREGNRILSTERDRTFVAKDRTRTLPKTIVDPTMRIVWEYWTGVRIKETEQKNTNNSGNRLVPRGSK